MIVKIDIGGGNTDKLYYIYGIYKRLEFGGWQRGDRYHQINFRNDRCSKILRFSTKNLKILGLFDLRF